MKKLFWTAGLVAVLSALSLAAPKVTYQTTGSSGNWTLDFHVQNTLGVNNLNIYFFGVLVDPNGIVGTPGGWSGTTHPTWTFGSEGGSPTVYNDVWIIDPSKTTQTIQEGQTLSGFKVLDKAALAPTSVQCFAVAYGFGAVYPGNDYFLSRVNPAFEETATPGAVPEPCTLAVLGGMCGLAAFRRRRR